MAVSTGNQYIWGFVHWAERNPHNSLNSVHWDEIKTMLKIFNLVNTTDGGTATATDPGDNTGNQYGEFQDIPGLRTANTDTNGIGWRDPSDINADASRYPESHIFTATGA